MNNKLTNEQIHWADTIQKNNFPSWIEAFNYAYQLGIKNNKINFNDKVVTFDVDDTLVMWDDNPFAPEHDKISFENPVSFLGSGKIIRTETVYLTPHKKHIQKLKGYANSGYFVIVWSMGGGAWAESVVTTLGLQDHVSLITGKPLYLYDDLPLTEALGERRYYQPKKDIE